MLQLEKLLLDTNINADFDPDSEADIAWVTTEIERILSEVPQLKKLEDKLNMTQEINQALEATIEGLETVTNISKMIPARKEINLKKVESESSDSSANTSANTNKTEKSSSNSNGTGGKNETSKSDSKGATDKKEDSKAGDKQEEKKTDEKKAALSQAKKIASFNSLKPAGLFGYQNDVSGSQTQQQSA